MGISSEQASQYVRRLLMSRMRLLQSHSFYGLLLMHMKFSVDEGLDTACTNGSRIVFGTAFLDGLADEELDFVLMHEILHVALQHCFRGKGLDKMRFNIACDIVVNSIILQENEGRLESISIGDHGESMHVAPNGEEGYLYTAEQVYAMLPESAALTEAVWCGGGRAWHDDHSRWGEAAAQGPLLEDLWAQRVRRACEAVSIRESSTGAGTGSLFALRLFKQVVSSSVDWRTVLQDFVQHDTSDFSFAPPDRRFADSPFFLPDLNLEGEDASVENIWFVVDTSGSVSDDELAVVFAELRSAIEQFGGRLSGSISFMQDQVTKPVPFASVGDVNAMKPVGGGGTDFYSIFVYLKAFMMDNPPACIVVLTDGWATFPSEKKALGIPVLWLIDDPYITPPWGRVVRFGRYGTTSYAAASGGSM